MLDVGKRVGALDSLDSPGVCCHWHEKYEDALRSQPIPAIWLKPFNCKQ